MTREMVMPQQVDFESVGRRNYWVMLEHDSLWGMHLIPLTVYVGSEARPGQAVVAFGSTHGNEYEGPIALKHLLGRIDLADVTGRINLVPTSNFQACRTATQC